MNLVNLYSIVSYLYHHEHMNRPCLIHLPSYKHYITVNYRIKYDIIPFAVLVPLALASEQYLCLRWLYEYMSKV